MPGAFDKARLFKMQRFGSHRSLLIPLDVGHNRDDTEGNEEARGLAGERNTRGKMCARVGDSHKRPQVARRIKLAIKMLIARITPLANHG